MENWQVVVLTAALSFVSAVVVAVISSLISQKNSIKQANHDKRTELYIEFYDIGEDLFNNPKKIFEEEYFEKLVEYKGKIKLIASQKTSDACGKLFEFVSNAYCSYVRYSYENDPENDERYYEDIYDSESGEELHVFRGDEYCLEAYNRLLSKYKLENKPDRKTISNYLKPVYTSMKKDLGTDD